MSLNRRVFMKLMKATTYRMRHADQIEFIKVPKQFQWPSKFDSTKGCSHGVMCKASRPIANEKAKAGLIRDMEAYVPPSHREHVRYLTSLRDWGRKRTLVWFYDPPERRVA